jgi:hypothetical protein
MTQSGRFFKHEHFGIDSDKDPFMKSKLTDLASIAEIIGAFAVVISLIYVGVQVNDSASAVRSASVNDAAVSVQNWYLQIGSDAQTSKIFYDGIMSKDPLPTHDEFQFLMMTHGAFLGFQNSYLIAAEGTIDIELREALTGAIVLVKDLPGMKRYWRQRKSTFHSGFVSYVDELFGRDTTSAMDMYRNPEVEPEPN